MKTTHLCSLGDELDLFENRLRPQDDTLIARGLIPPIPLTEEPDPVVIWGWSHIRRARLLGVRHMDVRIVGGNPMDSLMLALQLEGQTGSYSWSEQAAFVEYLEQRAGQPPRTEADMSELSRMARGDGALLELVGQYRKLPLFLRDAVTEGLVTLKTAGRMRAIPREFLLESQTSLERLTFSVRRQFLEMLAELIVHSSVLEDAGDRPSEARTVDDSIARPKTVAALCDWAEAALERNDPLDAIRRLRYPLLTDLEVRFERISGQKLKGTGISLRPPPYFEGDSYDVAFRFRNCTELRRRVLALGQIEADCEDLCAILK